MKQSLHIGLNYRNSPYELGGCENDMKEMYKRAKFAGRLTNTQFKSEPSKT